MEKWRKMRKRINAENKNILIYRLTFASSPVDIP